MGHTVELTYASETNAHSLMYLPYICTLFGKCEIGPLNIYDYGKGKQIKDQSFFPFKTMSSHLMRSQISLVFLLKLSVRRKSFPK